MGVWVFVVRVCRLRCSVYTALDDGPGIILSTYIGSRSHSWPCWSPLHAWMNVIVRVNIDGAVNICRSSHVISPHAMPKHWQPRPTSGGRNVTRDEIFDSAGPRFHNQINLIRSPLSFPRLPCNSYHCRSSTTWPNSPLSSGLGLRKTSFKTHSTAMSAHWMAMKERHRLKSVIRLSTPATRMMIPSTYKMDSRGNKLRRLYGQEAHS